LGWNWRTAGGGAGEASGAGEAGAETPGTGNAGDEVGLDAQLHLLVQLHQLAELVFGQLALEPGQQHSQPHGHRPGHVFVMPDLAESRVGGVVGAIDQRPLDGSVCSEALVHEFAARHRLRRQPLRRPLGLVGVVNENGIPQIERDCANSRHSTSPEA